LLPYFSKYPYSRPPSFNGEPVVYIFGDDAAIDMKTLPEVENGFFTRDYLVGFIRGWLAADGSVSKGHQVSLASNKKGLKWLYKHGPSLGFVPRGNYSYPMETNFGERSEILYGISLDRRWLKPEDFIVSRKRIRFTPASRSGFGKISSVTETKEVEEVFCFDVPTTHSFLLTRNILTGNCSFLAIDSPSSFDEMLYILMCLAPDTMIKTELGCKPISQITSGDRVLSRKDNGEYEYVNPSFVGETPFASKKKIELEFEDGYIVRVTEDHRFLTNRGLVEAKDLTESDEIQNYHEVS
jgi:hypothetical protein